MKFLIPVYPRRVVPISPTKKFRALLYPKGSDEPLLQSEHPSRELAEKSIRSWLDLEPQGKGVVEAIGGSNEMP